jgi:TonB family protein
MRWPLPAVLGTCLVGLFSLARQELSDTARTIAGSSVHETSASSLGVSPVATRAKTSEAVLRHSALETVRPTCPPDARTNEVVVARVLIGNTGRVRRLELLESPGPSFSDAVSEALRVWRFQPPAPDGNRPVHLSARLTFYFVVREGKCQVLYPPEAPYVERGRTLPGRFSASRATDASLQTERR